MLQVGILIFPQVEELDFIGPFEVLSFVNKINPQSLNVLLIAETPDIVTAFNGLRVVPDTILDHCPQLDILIIPGGKGRLQAMQNEAIKEFILQQSQNTKYVASVCTGAFILAEAGLLDGKKATTYHTAFAELEKYPNIKVEKAKVVHDGNIITSAGVSSGLELGFYLIKLLWGNALMQEVAEKIEYKLELTNVL